MKSDPSILVATWADGLFAIAGNSVRHELAGQPVRGLAADGRGGILAIVGGHSLRRRTSDGEWILLGESDVELSCCVPLGDAVIAGTDDARLLRVDPGGVQHWLTGFESVPGRDLWYAGSAVVDGKLMGPPLGVRSISVTCDGAALLANVHVGGIPRSADAGASWQPTIDIDCDVHQVCAHPTRPDLAIAAAAAGLCISRDAGRTWVVEQDGLQAHYCSAVAFGGSSIFVAASTDHFASEGAIYRRPIDGNGPLRRLEGMGGPLEGIADTGCIATHGSMVAVIDRSGHLHLSHDDGDSWSCLHDPLPVPSGLCIR
jgi:hypothetical protein